MHEPVVAAASRRQSQPRQRIDVPGSWVVAAMNEKRVAPIELAFFAKARGGTGTVSKWTTNGVAWVVWLGILGALGLPTDWRPPAGAVPDDDAPDETGRPPTMRKSTPAAAAPSVASDDDEQDA